MVTKKGKTAASYSLKQAIERRKRKNPLKIFTFDSLVGQLHKVTETFPDSRASNSSKLLKDAALGGFSLFYTQNPSFLSYQQAMQKNKGKNNAASLFGIQEILSQNQIRNILDDVAPSHVFGMFSYILNGLNYSGHLYQFRSFNDNLVVPLDGTRYFSSKSIHCQNCHQTYHSNDSITYSHSVVTPVIVKPGINQVISLIPEFITPQDGHEKQDCENAAAKRWLGQFGPRYRALGITILGDDLYGRDPEFRVMHKPLEPIDLPDVSIGSISLPSNSSEEGVLPLHDLYTKKCRDPSGVDSPHDEWRFLRYRFRWEAQGHESAHRPSVRGFSRSSLARCGSPYCSYPGRFP